MADEPAEQHEPEAIVEEAAHVPEEAAETVDDAVLSVLHAINASIGGVKAELEVVSGKLDRTLEAAAPPADERRPYRFGYRGSGGRAQSG